MAELENSEEFKRDLKAYIFVSMMTWISRSGYDFLDFDNETISCPSLPSMYTLTNTSMDKDVLHEFKKNLAARIADDPKSVLSNYVERIIEKSTVIY